MFTSTLPSKYDSAGLEVFKPVRPIRIMNGTPPQNPAEGPSFEDLHKRFREFKHATNNALAIILALGEMTQRNPDHGKRLTQVVSEKGGQIVTQLRELDELFKARASLNQGGK